MSRTTPDNVTEYEPEEVQALLTEVSFSKRNVLFAAARQARDRIAAGISLLCGDRHARLAFRAMNEAVARAARQREAGQDGEPAAQSAPR